MVLVAKPNPVLPTLGSASCMEPTEPGRVILWDHSTHCHPDQIQSKQPETFFLPDMGQLGGESSRAALALGRGQLQMGSLQNPLLCFFFSYQTPVFLSKGKAHQATPSAPLQRPCPGAHCVRGLRR